MKRRAVIVHLNDFVSVTPLVGGYLKAYALTEEEIRNHWEIERSTDDGAYAVARPRVSVIRA